MPARALLVRVLARERQATLALRRQEPSGAELLIAIDPERRLALLESRYEIASAAWEQAFVACATGRFADAIAVASPLLDAADETVRAQARLTAGSALRQLGRFDAARETERIHDLPDPVHRAHLLVSQAADAVGAGRARVAAAILASAELVLDEADAPHDPEVRRARIRAAWVGCEVSLAFGEPAHALGALDAASALSPGWPRHEAKTVLFEGVALRGAGEPDRARIRLAEAHERAVAIGAVPVAEVALRLLRGTSSP